jgi:alkylation response protein AidB-like acyl-CoA dehydrogenase
MTHPAIAAAENIAEHLLFPTAMQTDASPLVPRSHLDALADAVLYGIAGPIAYGGAALDIPTASAVRERLASGCLSTTFVWMQHTTPVLELSTSTNTSLRDACLSDLCAGKLRAGIALGGLHQGSAGLRAEAVEGGWLISGIAPYITGWGLIDMLLVAALTVDQQTVRCLVDARESRSLQPEPLRLLAANASATVRGRFDRHFVPEERVVSLAPYTPPPAYDGGGRPNGSLALGVTRRCLRLMGPSALDDELDARRRQLDEATEETMAEARAAAAALAARAASALIVHQGSRSILDAEHAARLYREAAFLLVFGTRPSIRSALLRDFSASLSR